MLRLLLVLLLIVNLGLAAWTLGWEVSASAGGFNGQKTRTDSGALLVVDATVEPAYASGPVSLKVPVSLAHRQTIGAALSETRGRAVAEPSWRIGRSEIWSSG